MLPRCPFILLLAALAAAAAGTALGQPRAAEPALRGPELPAPGAETIAPGPPWRIESLPPPDDAFSPNWDAVDLALSEPTVPSQIERPGFFSARRLGASWLAPGGETGFGMTDVECSLSWPTLRNDMDTTLLFTPGFGFHAWLAPRYLDLPAQVFDVYLDIILQQPLSERWSASLGVTPGLYGDFRSFHGEVFQVTGWGLASFVVGPKLSLLGGVAVVRQLESHVLPVGGVVWSPREDWRFELLFPRPRVAHRLVFSSSRSAWGYVAGQFGGGSWSITLDDAASTLVTYSDLRVMLGCEWAGSDSLSGVVEAGYVFSRNLSAFGLTQLVPEDSVLLHGGVTF